MDGTLANVPYEAYLCLFCDVSLTYAVNADVVNHYWLFLLSTHYKCDCQHSYFKVKWFQISIFCTFLTSVPSVEWFYLIGNICQINTVWYLSSKVLNIQVNIARIAERTQEKPRCLCQSSH